MKRLLHKTATLTAALMACLLLVPTTAFADVTGETATSPSPTRKHTIGEKFPKIAQIKLVINRYDGFMAPPKNDVYVVDVATRAVTLNNAPTITASAKKIHALVDAVRSAQYRKNPPCDGLLAVDGGQWPPQLTVSSATKFRVYGVASGECAKSDHSSDGNVISCDDYFAIFAALNAIAPSEPATCSEFW